MELLLNLVWLLLALPAYWLWRHALHPREQCKFSSLQCLLALACVLVVLFPVVSATDDLHAMRAEIEESPASKRNLRQAGSDRSAVWHAYSQIPVVVASSSAISAPSDAGWQLSLSPVAPTQSTPVAQYTGRAPPISFLG